MPQIGINNATLAYPLGAVVGGTSAVNGMVFDRGSKSDYDAWEELGNPGWGWDGLFPYFKKSATYTPPNEETVEKYGFTWDESAYGGGPIQATMSNYQWPGMSKSCAHCLKEGSFADQYSRDYVGRMERPQHYWP